MEENKQKIVFGCFVNGEFKGWRQDTFGTLRTNWAKIYTYSPEQVEIIKKNTRQELTNSGTRLMKFLFGGEMNAIAIDMEGQPLDENVIIDQISKQEQEKRSWGNFELRVYEIPFTMDEYEEWKMQAFNNNLPEPIEIHKFTTITNEN